MSRYLIQNLGMEIDSYSVCARARLCLCVCVCVGGGERFFWGLDIKLPDHHRPLALLKTTFRRMKAFFQEKYYLQ